MNTKIENIYQEVYELFPKSIELRRDKYRERDWIFPNHILISIKISKELCKKYNGNQDICKLALLLHDCGLVYKRGDSPKGHEERSVEYAEIVLKKYNFSKEEIEEVIKCIKATDPKNTIELINEKIVRSSDALSQINSLHFFAKAYFSDEFDFFVNWLKNKLPKNLDKICFDDEKSQAEKIIKFYIKLVNDYNSI